jgi:hypothetical protein
LIDRSGRLFFGGDSTELAGADYPAWTVTRSSMVTPLAEIAASTITERGRVVPLGATTNAQVKA